MKGGIFVKKKQVREGSYDYNMIHFDKKNNSLEGYI